MIKAACVASILSLSGILLQGGPAFAQHTRSASCIESVCLGDGVDELRRTKWRDRPPLPNPPADALKELKALGLFPGSRAFDLVPRIDGICEYDHLGQQFDLKDSTRYLVAMATWVPSALRRTQRFEVRDIEAIYETTKERHAKTLRERCTDIISRIPAREVNAIAKCSDERVAGYRYTSLSGDTLVDITGDTTNFEKVWVRLRRIDHWSEEPFEIRTLSRELQKLPACTKK
jgi:hypothetical protein